MSVMSVIEVLVEVARVSKCVFMTVVRVIDVFKGVFISIVRVIEVLVEVVRFIRVFS